jgi:hypothetical protein
MKSLVLLCACVFFSNIATAQTREEIRPKIIWRSYFRPVAEINTSIRALEQSLTTCNASARTLFPATRVEVRVRMANTGRVQTATLLDASVRRMNPWQSCALRVVRQWRVTPGEAVEFSMTLDWTNGHNLADDLLPNDHTDTSR